MYSLVKGTSKRLRTVETFVLLIIFAKIDRIVFKGSFAAA